MSDSKPTRTGRQRHYRRVDIQQPGYPHHRYLPECGGGGRGASQSPGGRRTMLYVLPPPVSVWAGHAWITKAEPQLPPSSATKVSVFILYPLKYPYYKTGPGSCLRIERLYFNSILG
ncbi:unnamed protein product [Nezara viridula]|uniref:Uncharacterized protein n=1 Tax=Nezara viridula TaxID=85310 RepID=A0A9P0HL32_NEZVI|nr:unnamed protein product [Nezara viridula]